MLHVNRMEGNFTRMAFTRGQEGLVEGKRRFDEIRERRLGEGGGLVSVYYHPCEWATTAFWDGVNFARGASPPPHEWQPAPLRPAAEMARGLALFQEYLAYIAARPDVELLTGRQLINLFPDPVPGRPFTGAELASVVEFSDGVIDTVWLGDLVLAPSELFALVNDVLLEILLAGPEGVLEGCPGICRRAGIRED